MATNTPDSAKARHLYKVELTPIMSAADSFWRIQASPKPSLLRSTQITTISVTSSSAHIAVKKNEASAAMPAMPGSKLVSSGMFSPMPPPVSSVVVLVSSRNTSATARLAMAK